MQNRPPAESGAKRRRRAGRSGCQRTAAEVTVTSAMWSYSGRTAPALTAARVGTTPGRRKMARLRRSERTALALMTARRSMALGRWKCKIAPGRLLRRPEHDGGGHSRVGGVVVSGAHCPCPDDGPRGHCAGPVEVRDLPRARSGDAGPAHHSGSRRTAVEGTVASAMWSYSGCTALSGRRPAWARGRAGGRWHASGDQSAQPLP